MYRGMPKLPEGVISMDSTVATYATQVQRSATYAIPVISLALRKEDNRRHVYPVTWVLTIQIPNLTENQSMASFMKKKKTILISTDHYQK